MVDDQLKVKDLVPSILEFCVQVDYLEIFEWEETDQLSYEYFTMT